MPGSTYAEACALYERRSRAARGREPVELRPSPVGWQVTGIGRHQATYDGVQCDAVRRCPGNTWPRQPFGGAD